MIKGTQSGFFAHVQEFDFCLEGQEFKDARIDIDRVFTNLFASSLINFGFALKLLRIKDQ